MVNLLAKKKKKQCDIAIGIIIIYLYDIPNKKSYAFSKVSSYFTFLRPLYIKERGSFLFGQLDSSNHKTLLFLFFKLASSSFSSWMQIMKKVHPNAPPTPTPVPPADPLVLTVWSKSLLFNCNGYTVYDANGNLVYRVDNYMSSSGAKAEILLMDGSGTPVLTIRRKRFGLVDRWMVYDGEDGVNVRLSIWKNLNILIPKCLAYASSTAASSSEGGLYRIEGSYAQRSCVVYDGRRKKVAEIKRKEAVEGVRLGGDVFRLIVNEPGIIEPAEAMALVIVLDQIFGSSRRFSD